ncbi:MAG: EAL domain-containing protein, partial [Candidatus Competibacterales bacterium]|nr:EAL domain-containing protein [Candidatus Competibacterales bacterium]
GEDMVPPGRLSPIAGDAGLVVPRGEWVLRTACTQIKAWLDTGSELATLSVNLSARQLQYQDMPRQIATVLEQTGLPPGHLELEITESSLMAQGARAEAMLQALKELGVRLAIDDFGTGYSSLAYLKRFPIDKLKVDRSFVRDITEDSNSREIAATIIAMGRNLRLQVLAEGVETEQQLDFLRREGCDTYQGFLFGRPVPADEFARQFLPVRD